MGLAFSIAGGGRGLAAEPAGAVGNLDPIHGDDQPFDPAPWLAAAPRNKVKTINYGGEPRIVLFGADKYMQRLPEGGTLLAWDKHCGQGADDSFADCEWAWCGKKVKREVFRWLWKGVIAKKAPLDHSPTKGGKAKGGAGFARVHVSQKPVELMRWCIEKVKPPQDALILDPYMGSGSTGVAALSLGHRFVGVEYDPGHFEVACARIEKAAAQIGLAQAVEA